MGGVTSAADAQPPLLGAAAWYRSGAPIGPVTGLYLDETSDRPEWVVVATERLLPLRRTALAPDGRLVVALPDLAVELSPPLAAGAPELHLGDENRLHRYYAAVLDRRVRPVSVAPEPPGDGTARSHRSAPGGPPSRGGDRGGRAHRD